MDAQVAVDMARQAMIVTMLVSAPVLLAGMLVGLVVGLLQAVTQVQEQSISFVPKLAAMIVALAFLLPWMITRMTDYCQQQFEGILDHL